MRNFYPSKWFAVIVFPLLGVGLVVGLFYLYQRDVDSAKTQALALQGADASISKLVAESDRDKDDLRDWEETLWHTNPDNPDTDGDGTKDGKEVLQNRDPAVKGPNDSLDRLDAKTQNALTTAGTSTASSTPGTTETVARELFGSYLMLKQGGKFDQASQSKLIAAVSDSIAKQTNLHPYTLADLKIVAGTPANVAAYAKAMNSLFTQFIETGKTKQNELILLKDALQTKNYAALPTIAASTPIYADLSLQLRSMSVPKDIASDHLTLVNGYQVYADMTKAMSEIQRDPIKAIVYIGQYQEIEKAGQQAVTNINTYVAVHSSQ